VFEEPSHERVTGIFFGFVGLCRVRTWQQRPTLDVNKGRGHYEELAGDVEIELLHQTQVFEVLLRDECDRDVVDVDLVLLDEVHEQIEGPLEGLQLNLDVFELRLEALV